MTLLEKYAPVDWEHLILPQSVKTNLQNIQKTNGYRLLLFSSPGTGKCLAKGTPIVMYDGSIKLVENIKVGDKLMGSGDEPRRVLATTTGVETMYEVKQSNGDSYVCNASHILTLLDTCTTSIVDMNVVDVLRHNNSHRYQGVRHCPDCFQGGYKDFYPEVAYRLGVLWIIKYIYGKRMSLTFSEASFLNEIVIDSFNMATMYKGTDYKITIEDGKVEYEIIDERNIVNILEKYFGVNPGINQMVQKLNRVSRIKVTEAFIDFCGFVNDDCSGFSVDVALEPDAIQLKYLFNSVGFGCRITEQVLLGDHFFFQVSAQGNMHDVKTKSYGVDISEHPEAMFMDIDIVERGTGTYYGFELDGNGRFLLGDFTMTHNTSTAKIISKEDNRKYLSGSNDFTIDVLRSQVNSFATNRAIDGRRKTIIIDEFENIRDAIQDSFKVTLDQCKTTNFIFCTNEVEKVNPAIRSRCTQFDYDFINSNYEEYFKLYSSWLGNIVREILKDRGIEYDKNIHAPALLAIRKQNFPDFRHTLVILQSIIDSGKDITVESVSSVSVNTKQLIDLYNLIEDHKMTPDVYYQEMCKYKGSEKDALMSLGEPYFKYLNDKGWFDKTILAADIVSEYCDKYVNSINKFVTFMACINHLRTLFK